MNKLSGEQLSLKLKKNDSSRPQGYRLWDTKFFVLNIQMLTKKHEKQF